MFFGIVVFKEGPPYVTKQRNVLLMISLSALAGGLARAEEVRTGSFADSLARMFSSEVRNADARLVTLRNELADLPFMEWPHQSPRHGFRSNPTLVQNEAQWIQIDLLDIYPIDMIAFVAADVRSHGTPEIGHAFPMRFKVEVASEADMSDAVVIGDETLADFPNPGRFPLVYDQPGREARYVRFTCTKQWPSRDDNFIWALGEIMVMSGNYNVAIHKTVTAGSGSLELAPNWMLAAVNDGQSMVGLPVAAEESTTNGFRSENARHAGATKWVTVDLGDEYALDEVRLIPAWPTELTDAVGMGYPRGLKVLLSNDPQFKVGVEQLNTSTDLTLPWNNPHTIRVGGTGEGRKARGRYLRVETLKLEGQNGIFYLALAELQAFSVHKNVALGKPVTASDAYVVEHGPSRWSPEFLVDGFSSRYRLTDWATYLHSLVKRRTLEREQAALLQNRDAKARRVADTTIMTGSAIGGIALLALFTVMVRHRSVRERDRERLREQIARDLHDELGSNLGSISLLGELGSRMADLPEEVRKDFAEIHRTAERSADAMRDIVWLIEPGTSTLRELVAKMREAAEHLVGDMVTLKVTPEEVRDCELPLLFRRHALFSFKETLNNVRRHASAESVEVRIDCRGGVLQFTVADDGVGFHVDERLGLGHGLQNLKQRALRLKGQCNIDSRPEVGTTVHFKAPLKSKLNGTYGSKDPSLAG
jgi:signal transduction histidine kinase